MSDVEKHVPGPEHPLPLGYEVFQSLRRARADSEDEVVVGGRDFLPGGWRAARALARRRLRGKALSFARDLPGRT